VCTLKKKFWVIDEMHLVKNFLKYLVFIIKYDNNNKIFSNSYKHFSKIVINILRLIEFTKY